MSAYLKGLLDTDRITLDEYRVLAPSGARSAQELYALTLHYADLYAKVMPGGALPKISSIAAQGTSYAFMNMATSALASPHSFAMGAQQPPNASPPVGMQMGLGSVPAPAVAGASLARIDHHTSLRAQGWPIRDQGQRGTCVAHALVSCKEFEYAQKSGSAPIDRSEQFVFWGAKQIDGDANDGTLNSHALAALQTYGICDEVDWPYIGSPLPSGTVHQGPPPSLAQSAALAAVHSGGNAVWPTSGRATMLYNQLAQGPVAIGVPVFYSPSTPALNNWNVVGMQSYGVVAPPGPGSVVRGGHAVCVVGFEPDVTEPAGVGWFIMRNSWGSVFGQQLPHPQANQLGYYAPDVGYGQISWSHIDQFLWEMAWL